MAAPSIRNSITPVSGASVNSSSDVVIGDLLICVTATGTTATGIPTHTTQSGWTLWGTGTQTVDDGANDGRLSVYYKVALAAGTQACQGASVSGGGGTVTSYTGLIYLAAGSYTLNDLKFAANTLTTNGQPNPPSITGLTGDWLTMVIGQWVFGASSTSNITAPTNYTERWEAPTTFIDLSLATRAQTALSNATEDPGNFGDDSAPACTIAITLGIRGPNVLERSAASSVALDAAAAFNRDLIRSAASSTTLTAATSGESVPAANTLERSAASGTTLATATVGQRDLVRSAASSTTLASATAGQRDLLRAATSSTSLATASAGQRDLLRAASAETSLTSSVSAIRVHCRSASSGTTLANEVNGVNPGNGTERAASSQVALSASVAGIRIIVRSASAQVDLATAALAQRELVREASSGVTVTTATSGNRIVAGQLTRVNSGRRRNINNRPRPNYGPPIGHRRKR
jgi:hypothetical protein